MIVPSIFNFDDLIGEKKWVPSDWSASKTITITFVSDFPITLAAQDSNFDIALSVFRSAFAEVYKKHEEKYRFSPPRVILIPSKSILTLKIALHDKKVFNKIDE